MICRLCLAELQSEDYTVHLYDNEGNIIEANLLKIIGNYFPQLQLTTDDPISTKVCEECSEHLEDFHRFYLLVQEKQKTLNLFGYQFLQVKSEQYIEDPSLTILNDMASIQQQDAAEFKFDTHNGVEPLLSIPQPSIDNEFDCGIADTADQLDDDMPPPPLELVPSKPDSSGDDSEELPLPQQVAKDTVHLKYVKGDEASQEQSKEEPVKVPLDKRHRNAAIIADFMPQLVCDMCKLAVANFAVLRAHFLLAHKRRVYVRCCGTKFDKPSSLVDHIEWHKNPDIFSCDLCQKRFRKRKCLQVHTQLRHSARDETRMVCPRCGKEFRGEKCLTNHLKRHTLNDGKNHPCPRCDKIFATAQRLRNHTASIHENIHPYVCDTCGKKFKFKPSFELHIQQHAGIVEPPQQCHICGEWLKNKNVLRLHHFRHDNSNCKCVHCGRVCPSRTALRGHVRYTHRMQSSHPCSFCGKTFKMAKNLQEHLAIHTGAQLYACPHCARECRSKSNMYVHIKRSHPAEWLQSKMARSNNPEDAAAALEGGGAPPEIKKLCGS